jgi:hypothetical protein
MACGSCGGGYAGPSLFVTADGQPHVPQPQTVWELTYPNGAVLEYHQEWAAYQAQSISGGTMRVIAPAPASTSDATTPPGEPSTSEASGSASTNGSS